MWPLIPQQIISHCPGVLLSGWAETSYSPFETGALVSKLPGAELTFRPGAGVFDLLFHKHAWSGSISVAVGDRVARYDLFSAEPQARSAIPIIVSDDEAVTIRSFARTSSDSGGDEVWLTGAIWQQPPCWMPTPDKASENFQISGPTLRIEPREILREFSCGDDPLDIFDGYAWWNGSRVHICRRWFGQSQTRIGDFHNSRIVISGDDIDYGDDPRPFAYQGRFAAIAARYSSLHGFRNHLYISGPSSDWERYYLMPPKGIEAGKNWSPFEDRSGRLNFVHSFAPLVVLRELRREAGVILLEALCSGGLKTEDGPNEFPAHRGGTNGLRIGNLVVGIGHTTRFAYDPAGRPVRHPQCRYPGEHQLIHRPFGWVLNPKTLEVASFNVNSDWDQNYWIIDPTSLFWNPSSNCFDLVTTEVERNFCDPSSRARAMIYQFSASDMEDIVARCLPQAVS